jgi:hypothetical protein
MQAVAARYFEAGMLSRIIGVKDTVGQQQGKEVVQARQSRRRYRITLGRAVRLSIASGYLSRARAHSTLRYSHLTQGANSS